MANKRTLKRYINDSCADLLAECVAVSLYGASVSEEDTDALLRSILKMESNYLSRISHPEPGMDEKKYFHILIEDFHKDANELIDQINNLC